MQLFAKKPSGMVWELAEGHKMTPWSVFDHPPAPAGRRWQVSSALMLA
ncbi:hypothetical protein [Schlesneria paludicola]|nr:hypothetical protein [Schlesneria paludicola]